MNSHTARTTELHALAICAWALVDKHGITGQADRVTTARECSNRAIVATTANSATSPIVDEIDAACTDAEVEHAIEAHARMILVIREAA